MVSVSWAVMREVGVLVRLRGQTLVSCGGIENGFLLVRRGRSRGEGLICNSGKTARLAEFGRLVDKGCDFVAW